MLTSAMKKYCFVRTSSLSDLEGEYELEITSVLTEQVSSVLAGAPHSTCSSRGKPSSAQEAFPKRNMEIAMSACGIVKASEAHGRVLLKLIMLLLEQEPS